MITLTSRWTWTLLAFTTAAVALASLILTPWLELEPCHLCIFQRTIFMLMALLAGLTAALSHPSGRGLGARLTARLFLALAALGSGVAAYQSWLQWQPMGEVSCIGGQPGLIERLVEWLGQQVPALFLASGFCEDRQLVILGLSLANWAFLVFIGALAAGAWALWQGRHPIHS